MTEKVVGTGSKGDPWHLKTPSGQSDIEAYRDEEAEPPALVVIAAKTEVRYLLRAIDGSPRHAEGARRLDAAGQRRRAEARGRGHGRSVGSLAAEPGRRLVRTEEGPTGPLCELRASGLGGARDGRSRAQPP